MEIVDNGLIYGAMAMVHEHDPLPLETFGTRLAIIRQYLGGWNVTRAARACGIDDQTWRNWEAGRYPQNQEAVCRRISEALGISYAWLMMGGGGAGAASIYQMEYGIRPDGK